MIAILMLTLIFMLIVFCPPDIKTEEPTDKRLYFLLHQIAEDMIIKHGYDYNLVNIAEKEGRKNTDVFDMFIDWNNEDDVNFKEEIFKKIIKF